MVSSAVYAASLLVIILIFGMWHNSSSGVSKGNNIVFIALIFLATGFFSWYYFTIFKIYRKEYTELEAQQKMMTDNETVVVDILEKTDDKITENFDKDEFIKLVTSSSKKNVPDYCESILKNLADQLNIVTGLFYYKPNDKDIFEPVARYAYYSDQNPPVFREGESLPGQAIKDKKILVIQNIPETYAPVISGLGSSKPRNLIMIPVYSENGPVGLIEIAIFKTVEPSLELALKELGKILGKNITNITK
ncbi:MAG: GAF domain-containing protein [Bacteroidales bacterium]|nr:GAF domain-containing protein [Bacteroidales bacterium]